MQSLTTGLLSGVMLLLGTSAFWIGVAVVSIGAVLHVTASSSVHVVNLSLRLRP